MSYRTWYTLSMVTADTGKEPENKLEIVADLLKFSEEADGIFEANGSTYDETQWDDMEEEMREFSQRYPDVIFCINGATHHMMKQNYHDHREINSGRIHYQ